MLLSYQVGDIIEFSADHTVLYQVDEKGIKLIAQGHEFLERWDKKARIDYYWQKARDWRDSENHSKEERNKMYFQMVEACHEQDEIYVTTEDLQKKVDEMDEAFGEKGWCTVRVENRWKFYVDKLMKYDGIWWLKGKEEDNYPSHYGIASWAEEEAELGIDYWAWDRTEWYDQQEKRARLINQHTGEVREVDGNQEGLEALVEVLKEEYEAYETGWLKDRDFKEDIRFEGNMDVVAGLKRYVRKLQGR